MKTPPRRWARIFPEWHDPTGRKEVNGVDAGKSTGIKSDEGKARLRYDASKHELRSEMLVFLDEDPAEFDAHEPRRNDSYLSVSDPGAAALVTRALRAAVRLDRRARPRPPSRREQVRHAVEGWDQGYRVS